MVHPVIWNCTIVHTYKVVQRTSQMLLHQKIAVSSFLIKVKQLHSPLERLLARKWNRKSFFSAFSAEEPTLAVFDYAQLYYVFKSILTYILSFRDGRWCGRQSSQKSINSRLLSPHKSIVLAAVVKYRNTNSNRCSLRQTYNVFVYLYHKLVSWWRSML